MEVNRYFNIRKLLDEILFALKPLNPVYCLEPDDPRLDGYYISIDKKHYMSINGSGDYNRSCDEISILKLDNIEVDITTTHGIEMFANGYGGNYSEEIIFELDLNTPFDGNMDDLVLLLTNLVKQIVPF